MAVQCIPIIRPSDIRPARLKGQFSLDKTVGIISGMHSTLEIA